MTLSEIKIGGEFLTFMPFRGASWYPGKRLGRTRGGRIEVLMVGESNARYLRADKMVKLEQVF